MQHFKSIKQFSATLGVVSLGIGLTTLPASALTKTKPATTTATDQAKVTQIISKGDTEISRRLTTLNSLSSKISSAQKLSAGDSSTLSSEVSTEVSGLTTLKTKLDADTDLATAKSDAQSIFSDYRVYALIVPKVDLVRTADSQQVTEGQLTTLAGKLQSRITADQTAGKDVSALQSELSDLNTKVSAAQTISAKIETGVIGLQPSDYNSNHAVLSGDRDQLKTAQSDIKAANTAAKNIVASLKTL